MIKKYLKLFIKIKKILMDKINFVLLKVLVMLFLKIK